jgi:hypothetical protein
MKILTTAAATRNEQNFRFNFKPDSKSLQVWEEENPEYASWKLTEDREESASN